MGAYVTWDPYWDPVHAYADRAEAEAACLPGGVDAGCHIIWTLDASPGDTSTIVYTPKPWEE